MKNVLTLLLFLCSITVFAQNPNQHSSSFELGEGLAFSMNNGDYSFKLGGMIQPTVGIVKDSINEAEYLFNARRTYFNIGGKAQNEHLEFLIQTDFSLGTPLLDAWVSYAPSNSFKVTFGQKQTIANNREMMLMEDQLQFLDRSLLSTSFSNSGREFGIFIENKIELGSLVFLPQIAITSGDGRNSFGASSTDPDLGGFKYAARLDIFPMGMFSDKNDKMIADLYREQTPKVVIGLAASYNDGASNQTGEGHGDVFLYNYKGQNQLPDYRQLYSDLLFKWNGFSFLGEYNVSTAKGLEGAYINETASVNLVPTQISEFLSLGTGYNAQLGYVTKSGYGVDLRYSVVSPEFDMNQKSVIQTTTLTSFGITKYVKQNSLKLNAAVSSFDYNGSNSMRGDFMVQVIF